MDQKTINIKSIAEQFLTMTASGKVIEAFDLFVSPDFRHHNIYFKGDAESLLEAMIESAENFPAKKLEIQFAIGDENRVGIYSKVIMFKDDPGTALVHFFRFDGNKIIEMWDLAQPAPNEIINENGLF
jgi:predicted SnoaL-like aldol condensation-catalyzing enzyme